MENLWPDDLFKTASKHNPDEIEQALTSQADGLSERSNGLLTGIVKDRSIAPGRAWAFGLYPADQSAKETQLFIVRSEDGRFPVVIESFDSDRERYKRVSGLSAFRGALQEIFLSPQTRRIVKLLTEDALNVSAVAKQVLPKRQKRDAGSILLGRIFKANGKELSHVSIFGVSGYINKEDVERFLLEPNEPSSLIETLNDKYVITLKFIDACKLSLSEKELRVLQAESRKALG